jgi:succinoglycan biosynthesis transport protein ExoP
MRRPALDRAFPQANSQGLSNILVGQGRLENYVTSTDLPNLDILTAGPQPPSPAELLGTNHMREMLVQATEKYDQVIFDGPPVLLVSDALVLATQVDGVVMVCRAKTNSRGVVHRARTQLERVGAHILGAVLNAVESTRGGYFRKQYRAFYDYMAEEEEGARARLELPAGDQRTGTSGPHDVPEQMGGPDEGEDKS